MEFGSVDALSLSLEIRMSTDFHPDRINVILGSTTKTIDRSALVAGLIIRTVKLYQGELGEQFTWLKQP